MMLSILTHLFHGRVILGPGQVFQIGLRPSTKGSLGSLFLWPSIGLLIPRLRRRASRTIIGSGRLMPSLTWPASAPYRYNTNRGSDGRASSQHRKSCATVSRLLNSGSSKHPLCCLRRQRAPLHRPLDDASAHGQGTCCLDDKLR